MGSHAMLAHVLGACAVRLLLGLDAGAEYDTTALSANTTEQGEPRQRDPFALRLRPDILLEVFNARNFLYMSVDGTFVQPFFDDFEAGGEARVAARLHGGRGLRITPSLYGMVSSSNEFMRSQDEVPGGRAPDMFYVGAAGGGFMVEYQAGRRLQLVFQATTRYWFEPFTMRPVEPDQEEAWNAVLERLRLVQPSLNIDGSLATVVAITRTHGIGIEAEVLEGLFLWPDIDHQLTINGRVSWVAFWARWLRMDLALGVMGIYAGERMAECGPDVEEGTACLPLGERPPATSWRPDMSARAAFMVSPLRSGRLLLQLAYERTFEQLAFRSAGSVHDYIGLTIAVGPYEGFSGAITLSWTRFEVETADVEQDLRLFFWYDTIGASIEVRYVHEIGDFGVGPFFEGYVYTLFPEVAPYDTSWEYLPPGYDVVEAVLFFGVRGQWNYQHGGRRARRRGESQFLGESANDRRLARNRMTREEREAPVFQWGMRRIDEEEEIERDDGFFGRMEHFQGPVDRTDGEVDQEEEGTEEGAEEEVEEEVEEEEGEGGFQEVDEGGGEAGGEDEQVDEGGTNEEEQR